MTARSAQGGFSHVAALLAVALLLFAGVRSTLMQAQTAASPRGGTPSCMNMGGARGAPSKPEKPAKACAFCAVAAHLPVCGSAPAPAPPATVAWLAWRPAAGLGPRGPPALDPRARGPPTPPLIA